MRKKFLARVKDADTVVLACPLEEKEMLFEAAPDIYFEASHYRGWAVDPGPDICDRDRRAPPPAGARAFIIQAPKTVLKAWRSGQGNRE